MVISKKDRIALVISILLVVFTILLIASNVASGEFIFVVLFFILIYWGVRIIKNNISFISFDRRDRTKEVPDSLANELDKLAQLRQKGVITDDEFLSFKRKLLDE